VAVRPKPLQAKRFKVAASPKIQEPAPVVAENTPPPPTATPPAQVEEAAGQPPPVTAGVKSADAGVSQPAAAPPEAADAYRLANFGAIRSSILGNLRYPLIARRQGWSGMVEVAFMIAPDGTVSDLRVQASSGFPVLDEQALAAVRRSAPLTPPRIAVLLVVPITFQLN
jgi:protein TonB